MSSERIDIDKRRAALKEIDEAKFGWHHIRACMVAGTGFFMDAYDIFAINFASTMIGYVYYNTPANKGGTSGSPANVDLGLKISVSVGTVIGQLLFGYLADRLGRKKMYGVELMIIIGAAVATALCGNGLGPAVTVTGTIMFWRVIMGIGIGGDYPLSAIITSEFATTKRRGAMMGAVFAMQGFGILAAAVVMIIVMLAFKGAITSIPGAVTDYPELYPIDYCWRLVLGLGAVPGILALYYRLTIPETPRYTMDVEHNINKATSDITSYLQQPDSKDIDGQGTHQADIPKASWSDFIRYFGQWKNGKILLGTSVSWFCLDMAFYGVGLNNSTILTAIGFASDPIKTHPASVQAFTTLYNAGLGNLIITLLGTIPGYWVTVALVDSWGRKPIQLMGFAILTVLLLVMGLAFDALKAHIPGFIVIFTLLQFFENFGPNSTTFIVPGEVFPTRYRSTGHGISAASGKIGAIVSQIIFVKYKDHGGAVGSGKFVGPLLAIFSIFMFIGFLASFLIPETKGLSLEELSNEEDHFDVVERKDRLKSEV